MVGNIFYNNKTAEIDNNFRNVRFNMLFSCSLREIYEFIEESMYCD